MDKTIMMELKAFFLNLHNQDFFFQLVNFVILMVPRQKSALFSKIGHKMYHLRKQDNG